MKPEILVHFYRSIIESIINRFGNMTYDDRNSLSSVIRIARRLTGVDLGLPDLRGMFYCRVKSRFRKLIADPNNAAAWDTTEWALELATACTQRQCVFYML